MGRGIPSSRPGAHASLLWHREVNQQMLEEMWHNLVTLLHPTLHHQPQSLDELFELLKDATWHDFFQVFPYELREHATYLGHDAYHDELDALALLLASPHSKERFQRYFEQYAGVITSMSAPAAAAAAGAGDMSGRHSPAAAATAAGGTLHFRLGLPLLTAADEDVAGPADGHQQQQQVPQPRPQQEMPVARRRSQAQQQQPAQAAGAGPVAYVSPAAPGRLLAAAQSGWPHPPAAAAAARLAPLQAQQLQQQQPGGAALNFVNAMLAAHGMSAEDIAHFNMIADRGEAARANAAGPAGHGLAAAAPNAGAAAAAAAGGGGAAARLSGRRRTWLEACDADAHPAAATAGAAGTAGTAAAARAQSRQAVAAPVQQQAAAAAGSSAAAAAAADAPTAAAAAVNNSGVWRAVHEALTSDDEGLLQCVSRLVPYSFAGQLRDAGETAAQLQALADSRPVPAKVVAAVAERLAASSGVQLVRVSASSGYSRRAAAAAAALACPSRMPFYVSLAGCCSQEDVEAALSCGVFAAQQQQQQQQQQQTPELEQQQQQFQQPPGREEQQQRQQGQAQVQQQPQQQQQQQQHHSEEVRQQQMLQHLQDAPQPAPQQQQQHEPPPLRQEQARADAAGIAAAMPVHEPAAAAGSEYVWRFGVMGPPDRSPSPEAPSATAAWADSPGYQPAWRGRPLFEAAAAMAAGAPDSPGYQPEERHGGVMEPPFFFWGPLPEAAATAAGAAGPPGEEAEEYLDFSDSDMPGGQHVEEDSEFGDTRGDGNEEEHGTDRCAEALAARLTLLGMCSEQPLLLMLDEADAAMLQQGAGQQTGGLFRPMLLRVLRQLPQVVLLVTDSFEPDALADSSALRKQGRPAVYSLPDGKLSVTSYSLITRATYHYSCVHNF